jgi:hypothetical protein
MNRIQLTSEQVQRIKNWIKVLKNKEYEQGQETLKQINEGDEPKFCCLGVACDLSGLGEWKYPHAINDRFSDTVKFESYFVDEYDHDTEFFPDAVEEYYGIDAHMVFNVPDFDSKNKNAVSTATLTELNDFTSLGFPAIGQVIENNLFNQESELYQGYELQSEKSSNS